MKWEKMFAYHKWATERCFSHAASFDDSLYVREGGSSFPTIRETAVHMIGVEKLWLLRMNGNPSPAFERYDMETAEKAAEQFMLLHAEMELYFASLSEEQWQEELSFTNLKGDQFSSTREEMLFTLVNHASYHRGQIASLLRQFGKEGVALDYLYFTKEKNSR